MRECHFYIRQRMPQIKAMEKKKSQPDVPAQRSPMVNNATSDEPAKKKRNDLEKILRLEILVMNLIMKMMMN